MASITKHTDNNGNTVYKVTVSAGRKRGKVTRTWKPSDTWNAKTIQRELNRYAAQLEDEFKSGRVISHKENIERERLQAIEDAKIKTLREYVYGVYLPSKELSIAPKTYYGYKILLDTHILPALGDFLIKDITPAQISKLIMDFQRRGYAHSSAVKLYVILNCVFKMAVFDDSIRYNPMQKVPRPKRRKSENDIDDENKAYNAGELKYILQCLENEPIKWQAYINLVADTGMRRGEACALQWRDINRNAMTVTVRRNLQYDPIAGIYTDAPKNGRARIVDIGNDTMLLLRRLRNEQSTTCISKWVFTQDGIPDPMHPDTPTRYFSRLGKRYNIYHFHPHKLRHTSASVAITHGADIISVSQRLGHSDPALTLRMYAHANEDSIRKAGQAVRDAVRSAKAQGE